MPEKPEKNRPRYDWEIESEKLGPEAEKLAKESIYDPSPHRLSLILTVLVDAYSRPEIMAAAGSVGMHEQMQHEPSVILWHYTTFAQRKWPKAFNKHTTGLIHYLRLLGTGTWAGPDVPEAIETLLRRGYFDDRDGGKND